jgi:hypothetical protein
MKPAPPVTKYFIDFNFVYNSLKGCQYHNLKKFKNFQTSKMVDSMKYYREGIIHFY